MINYLALAVALIVSAVSAYYSIVGLVTIFAGAATAVVVMGIALELGKLVSTSWLYRNWKDSPILLKTYLMLAVVILMAISSMGIFGFLSKAHIEQTLLSGDNTLVIQSLDQRIQYEQARIDDAQKVIGQLDQAVQTLINFDRIRGNDGAIATREAQAPERQKLNQSIDQSITRVTDLRDQKQKLEQQQLKLEAEVGPIKYISDMIFQESNRSNLEKAVRYCIILIVFVFDPLAVGLLLAANHGLNKKVIVEEQKNLDKASKRGVLRIKNTDI